MQTMPSDLKQLFAPKAMAIPPNALAALHLQQPPSFIESAFSWAMTIAGLVLVLLFLRMLLDPYWQAIKRRTFNRYGLAALILGLYVAGLPRAHFLYSGRHFHIGSGQTFAGRVLNNIAWWQYPLIVIGNGQPNGLLITTSRAYYVAPSGTATCTYNGDGGTGGCSPNDSNQGLAKGLPFATVSKAASVVNGLIPGPGVVLSVNFANAAAASTGDCYKPNNVVFYGNTNQSWSKGVAYYFTSSGGLGLADSMPESRLELIGDTTTPANVVMSGVSGNCNTTTPSTTQLVTVAGGVVHVTGLTFNYAAAQGLMLAGNSLAILENLRGTNDSTANVRYFTSCVWSNCRLGGTWNITNYFVGFNLDNGRADDRTSNGALNYTYSANAQNGDGPYAFEIQEFGHYYINSGTYTSNGAGAYTFFNAQDDAYISNNDGDAVTFNYSGNTGVIVWQAQAHSYILGSSGATSGNWNWTQSAGAPTVIAYSQTDSTITLGGSAGKGIACSEVKWKKGGVLYLNWFATGQVCGDRIPLLNRAGVAYTAIAGSGAASNTEQILGTGADTKMYATSAAQGGLLSSVGRHITAYYSGVWSTLNNSDTLIVTPHICQNSNCSGGTNVSLGATAAFADGAGGAITNQGWWFQMDCDVLTVGGSGTVACEGHGQFFNAATGVVNVQIANTGTATISTNVDEYFDLGFTWSNNSATNTIQVRTMKINVPF